jgi:hypothetical protein
MSNVILTSECEKCKYGSTKTDDKARLKVWCSYKEKEYFFGACIPCDYYEKPMKTNDGIKNF